MDLRTLFRGLHMSHPNAATARRGNRAEDRLVSHPRVKELLETYFGVPIQSFQKVPGRKKSDACVLFTDGTRALLQNKDGEGGGRGWSADRRPVDQLPLDEDGKRLLETVCLRREGLRPEVPRPEMLLDILLLGTDVEFMPTHFTHTRFSEEGDLLAFSIAPAPAVLSALNATAYPTLVPKRTCVHLGPGLYLQRKGGGASDHAPDNIQFKLREFPSGVLTHLQ
jgi:hypothetical protein